MTNLHHLIISATVIQVYFNRILVFYELRPHPHCYVKPMTFLPEQNEYSYSYEPISLPHLTFSRLDGIGLEKTRHFDVSCGDLNIDVSP